MHLGVGDDVIPRLRGAEARATLCSIPNQSAREDNGKIKVEVADPSYLDLLSGLLPLTQTHR